MRITITCEDCGHRHRLERTIRHAGELWIICHRCEMPLRAVLARPEGIRSAPSASFAAVWGGCVDLRTGTAETA